MSGKTMSASEKILFGTDEIEGNKKSQREIMAEHAVSTLFDKKNKLKKTNMSRKQVIAHARGRIFAQAYGISPVDRLLDVIEEYLISVNGAGRKELVEIFKSSIHEPDHDASTFQKLLGG